MDDKKRKITLSALNVFKEKGIEKATVSEIVKGAGIAQGTFYLYFPSKLSVIPAIAEVMIEKAISLFHEQMDNQVPFTEQLQILIEIVFEYTENYREIYALLYVGLGSNQQLNEWEAIYEPYYELISSLLRNAQQNGEVCDNLHAKRTATLLIGLLETAAEQSYLYDEQNEEIIQLKKQDVYEFAMNALKTN
ncbi:TetR family transcriptional regulator [Pseudogracilibacillus auburnensis]|uniref:TetR family transcriptional regulator n=1 Tax=Pseudogracilibacillus auburnensis TaxID=1494959 RepID=UPI001A975D15|nr:TetR family transcriptional regulator [Pseudogracilibacillus auburnensis]MBO1002864.1 TetR family transcriptional regulator [Pseudogracilibacillus auburnensis]